MITVGFCPGTAGLDKFVDAPIQEALLPMRDRRRCGLQVAMEAGLPITYGRSGNLWRPKICDSLVAEGAA